MTSSGFLDCREDDGDWLCMECDRYVRMQGHRPDCPQRDIDIPPDETYAEAEGRHDTPA